MASSTFQDIEWRILGAPLIFLLVALITGSGWIYGAQSYLKEMKALSDKNTKTLEKVEEKQQKSEDALKILKSVYPKFKQLYERGFIGDEQRLRWMQQLYRLEDEIKLEVPALSYEISAGERLLQLPKEISIEEDFKIFASEMFLRMALVHEEDLFTVLDALKRQEPPVIFKPKKCTMERSGRRTSVRNPRLPNVQVECALEWYGARIEGGKESER